MGIRTHQNADALLQWELSFQELLVNRTILIFSSIAVVIYAFLQLRTFDIGWHARDTFQVFIMVTIVLLAFYRKRIAVKNKVLLFVCINAAVGLLGLHSLGFFACGIWCIPIASVLLALSYSKRMVVTFSALSILAVCLIALGFTTKHLHITTSPDYLMTNIPHWFAYVLCIGFFFITGSDTILSYRKIVNKLFKQIEQQSHQLRESEIKHKTLVNNIPGMVYKAYPDWSAEIISGSEDICGYTNDELNSKERNWLSIIHPDDIEAVYRDGSKLAQIQKDIVQKYRIKTKSGDIRWVEDHKASVFSAEEEFMGIDGIVYDITSHKLAERERDELINALQKALKEIKTLKGIIPICSHCKKIRDDKGYWNQLEYYVEQHSEADFSHGICPDCINKYYSYSVIYNK